MAAQGQEGPPAEVVGYLALWNAISCLEVAKTSVFYATSKRERPDIGSILFNLEAAEQRIAQARQALSKEPR